MFLEIIFQSVLVTGKSVISSHFKAFSNVQITNCLGS